MRTSTIRTAWGIVGLAALLIVHGCTREVTSPPMGGGLKVLLSKDAADVDHGWLVVDGDVEARHLMVRAEDILESDPIMVLPGRHLFEITAVDAQEKDLYYGRATATVEEGSGSLDLEIDLRLIAPDCSASADTLDFGTIPVGSAVQDTVLIANGEGALGDLVLDVGTDCEEFSLISGGGPRVLGPGQSFQVIVRYAPSTAGETICTLLTGSDCDAIILRGTGEALPDCSVDPAGGTLDFGTLVTGTSNERSITLTNTGGGLISGSIVLADCVGFTVVSGGGAFDLLAGQTHTVTVRFTPDQGGDFSCTLETGTACGPVTLTGAGQLPPDCVLNPAEGDIDFGEVSVGAVLQQNFTLSNGGGGVLTGSVDLGACTGFSLVSGGGAFSLTTGQSLTVTVRFTPQAAGDFTCEVSTGTPCGSVALSGSAVELPDCALDPSDGTLDFGLVSVGSIEAGSFTLTNTGGGLLTGEVGPLDCAGFSIVSGGGPYSLTAGQARTVEVHFLPTTGADYLCTVPVGPCGEITLLGQGELQPDCTVSPSGGLDFGSLLVGDTQTRTFTLSNTGGGDLEGAVALTDCTAFTLVSGAGPYSLAGGQTRTVTVEFNPEESGDFACTVTTGTGCGEVELTGSGTLLPACSITPADQVLDWGLVPVGGSAQKVFSIKNTGGGLLEGLVELDCDEFSLVTGGGPFSLAAGQIRTVTVEFSPPVGGDYSCELATGTECGDVTLQGRGDSLPSCEILPVSQAIDWGLVPVGDTVSQTFTIENTGGQVLSGDVAADCDAFAVTEGGGPFDLASGQILTVTVAFTPPAAGEFTCSVSTGTTCGGIALTGEGEALPVCTITPQPAILNFGLVPVGQSASQTFTLQNTGGGALAGEVFAECSAFSVTSGAGPFLLSGGQSLTVTVTFAPQLGGDFSCSIETGLDCGPIPVTGTGDAQPMCVVTPGNQVVDFGTVLIGQSWQAQVTITNAGGGTLAGEVGLDDCGGFRINSGAGPYSLTAGQTRIVQLDFTPWREGTITCRLGVGAECDSLTLTGVGLGAPVCLVDPEVLDFGTVRVDFAYDLDFMITNTGTGTLTGTISEQSPIGEVVQGSGSYALGAGQSHGGVVRVIPDQAGPFEFQIQTGTSCTPITCVGIAESPGELLIEPDVLNFGEVFIGTSITREFTLRNGGGGVLAGHLYESCDEYNLESGGGPFALGPGDSLKAVVSFTPSSADTFICFVQTAAKGLHIACAGVGVFDAEAGPLQPTSLDFGQVPVGEKAERTFVLSNPGPEPERRWVKQPKGDFRLLSEEGGFTLAPGETRLVVLEFAPTNPGPASCRIKLKKCRRNCPHGPHDKHDDDDDDDDEGGGHLTLNAAGEGL